MAGEKANKVQLGLSRFLLVLGSLLVTLLVIEFGFRAYYRNFGITNFLYEARSSDQTESVVQFDPELGWVSKAGYLGAKNKWGTRVTIGDAGIRSNGIRGTHSAVDGGRQILVVGDSFAFGSGVEDHETWPAHLEEFARIEVLNGGVGGYGIDQIYLRTRQLMEKFQPQTVILSFIPDDVIRAQISRAHGRLKPYFVIQNGELKLIDKHIVIAGVPIEETAKFFLGYSFAVHSLMTMPRFHKSWLEWGGFSKSTEQVHDDGPLIACGLLQVLNQAAKRQNTELYLLVQYMKMDDDPVYAENANMVREVLKCSRLPRSRIIDLRNHLELLAMINPPIYSQYFYGISTPPGFGHMTPSGNEFVAKKLFERLTNNGSL